LATERKNNSNAPAESPLHAQQISIHLLFREQVAEAAIEVVKCIPQGLKPTIISDICGTTEVVP
jgi:hypothetical protein